MYKRLVSRTGVAFSSIKERILKERASRLQTVQDSYTLKSSDNLEKIRNIGIIAHIDAGKTTVTERMLFYAGALAEPGEVHEGNTKMDFLEQERERGITIQAAAISFNWSQFQFNLIDTPGHIDFSSEVERSLRVLDGAVTIFDGVNGVQAQSETVWLQANSFNIPRIAFVNKMDRTGASLEFSIQDIESKLNVTCLAVQMPIGESETFKGVVDLITMEKIVFTDQLGTTIAPEILADSDPLYKKAMIQRETLLENISLLSDSFSQIHLSEQQVTPQLIKQTIRKILNENPQEVCVLGLGSALKNKGIQNLMDMVIDYLPSPSERGSIVSQKDKHFKLKLNTTEKTCAYIFKLINHKEMGLLAFMRVYSGKVSSGIQLYNSRKQTMERCGDVYRVRADQYVNVQQLTAGDIVAVQGLKNVQSGDTLVEQAIQGFSLEDLKLPEPVFSAAVNYESNKDKNALDTALHKLCLEDASLKYTEDFDTGQLILKGMGELHLEIIKDRLLSDYNLKIYLSKMRVAYRESISQTTSLELKLSKLYKNQPIYAFLELEISREQGKDNEVTFGFKRPPEFDVEYNYYKMKKSEKSKDDVKIITNTLPVNQIGKLQDEFGEDTLYSLESISYDVFHAIETSIQNSLQRGTLLSYPMMECQVKIVNGHYAQRRSSQVAFELCSNEIMKELKQSSPVILEPVMDIIVSSPNENSRTIINDIIGRRRGRVTDVEEQSSQFGHAQSQKTTIRGVIPVQSSVGYATYLRSISKGAANFNSIIRGFESVSGQRQQEILEEEF